MTKTEIAKEIRKSVSFHGKGLDIDSLCQSELITSMRDVDGIRIISLYGNRHQVIFTYKSDTSNQGVQTIVEDYLY